MVETSGWLTNVPYRTPLLYTTIRFNVRRHVLRHVTSNKMKKTQGQGQIKVKGQGHLKIFTILYVIVAIT